MTNDTINAYSEQNLATDAANIAEWATQPDTFMAYYKLVSDQNGPRQYREAFRTHGTLQTWLGVQLGIITEARVYPHNFGARMVSVRVRGNNGATYYGRASYDNGEVINLRKAR